MKLFDYIRGKRRGRQAYRIELEAMRDPLLGDAIEGYDSVPGDHSPALERLEARIAGRAQAAAGGTPPGIPVLKRRRIRLWSAAAAVLIACAAGGTLLLLQREPVPGGEQIAANVETKESRELSSIPPAGAAKDATDKVIEDAEKPVGKSEEAAGRTASEPVRTHAQVSGRAAASVKSAPGKQKPEHADNIKPEDTGGVISEYSAHTISEEVAPDMAEVLADVAEVRAAAPEKNEKPAAPDNSRATASAIEGRAAGIEAKKAKTIRSGRENPERVVDVPTGEPTAAATPGDTLPVAMSSAKTGLDEVVVVAFGTQRNSRLTGAAKGLERETAERLADTASTAAFRRYIEAEAPKAGIEGRARLEFEVNAVGRPYRIRVVESTSKEAGREAERLLRKGPAWEASKGKKRITVIFGQPPGQNGADADCP